jgi:hypothetical protein
MMAAEKNLEIILLGLEGAKELLIKNRQNGRYRETAEPLYDEANESLVHYGGEAFIGPNRDWKAAYGRVFPLEACDGKG